MADLTVLIRLHKHELDEKRRILAGLYSAMAEQEKRRRALEESFKKEKEAVDRDGDIHFTFAGYAEAVKKKREEFLKIEAGLEKQIEQAKDSMMETFSELKKYEMTQQERERLEEEERALKEGRMMDDIAIEGFRRKNDDNR